MGHRLKFLIAQRWPSVVGLGLVILFLLWYLARMFLHYENGWPIDYVVTAEFQSLPNSDKAMEQWLLNQPGVYIVRVSRNGNKVIWTWGHIQRNLSDPITPNIRIVFERFGYRRIKSYSEQKAFRDR